ncbi:hypothetical protein B0H13DRAFT_2167837 [Mycena leptocephala]|nr:hypothetical protein B0H13DRAFT_2167837 [Mycena leptocephala]
MARAGACRFLSSPLLFSLLFLPSSSCSCLSFSLLERSIRHPFCPCSLGLPSLTDSAHSTPILIFPSPVNPAHACLSATPC